MFEAGQFRGRFRLSTGPRKGPTMSGNVFLPFVEPIAGNAEFPGDLGGRALTGVEELDRVALNSGVNRRRSAIPTSGGAYRAPF